MLSSNHIVIFEDLHFILFIKVICEGSFYEVKKVLFEALRPIHTL